MNENYKNPSEKKLYETLKNDISEGGFSTNISKDYSELKEFFLTDERKKQLTGMGKFKGFFYMLGWMLKDLLLKLNPTRRLLLILGIVFLVSAGNFGLNGNNVNFSYDTSVLGGIIILFILMLELKDKLLAKDELNAGKSVQVALMSDKNPKVAGWKIWLFTEPANDVGGDLVDFVKTGESKYGITLADVSGKGLAAALLMSKLQTIVRAFAPDMTNLSEFGEKINKVFHKDILPNSFASMVYCSIQENSSNLEIFNAGHLPPVILKENEIEILPKGNVALGLSNSAKFTTQNINLESGNSLIIFSDGVTEARNFNGTFFGTERIYKILKISSQLSPQQVGERLLQNVKTFIANEKKHDDLSIVILKRSE
ncbi:MAG: serine/threonine-protein phosphatase [Ignavibacteriae bacterium]|nr:serine/threonine-protein phosphatase [Ignavibacteriota bacterium]